MSHTTNWGGWRRLDSGGIHLTTKYDNQLKTHATTFVADPARKGPDVRLAGRITEALGELAHHWPGTAEPGRVVASQMSRAFGSKTPMPADVLSLRREVVDTLTSLTLVVCAERDLRGPAHHDDDRVATLTSWLMAHAAWLASPAQPDAPTATVHELEHLARRVREVALMRRPVIVDIGPCPERHADSPDDTTAHCAGQLHAVVRRDDDLLPSVIRCTDAPEVHAWTPTQWQALAARMEGVVAARAWLPVVDAAAVTGVPAGTIRRWVAEGSVPQWGHRRPRVVDVEAVRERQQDKTARVGA